VTYPKDIHPKQRQPAPSERGTNWAVQPYKPKPLRGTPPILSTEYWEPDEVRFKGQTVVWTVMTANRWVIRLARVDSRGKTTTKRIRPDEQHKLEIVYQPPRSADTTLAAHLTGNAAHWAVRLA
jgi:hypothetical protein